jgi:Asp-tRNA(Asn)/Glu-tRNA(Gln) amidotransferase A subunit family amidase
MPDRIPATWPIRRLVDAFRAGSLSPLEVVEDVLARIDAVDGELHAYLAVTADLARTQAERATRAYRSGEAASLLGVPVSVKDAFHVRGVPTTFGSAVHDGQVAKSDSGVASRLRAAGAVFTGKTNTAEFGQSATTDNLLGPDTANPWDPSRTPGGSSGGAAASVAAALATVAVGSDGGGSIRIPAAFCGLVGLKPTTGSCPDERGFRAMSDFVSPGPLAWRVDDARILLGVLADREFARERIPSGLRIGWCLRPEDHPVHRGAADAVHEAAGALAAQGHRLVECRPPISGWERIFGPLVLDDEHRERGHLIADEARLTHYELATLRAARDLDPDEVTAARQELPAYRRRVAAIFDEVDVLLTPTVATPAFPLGKRPTEIDGEPVGALWGAFPFTVPFNVAGLPAITLPCGLVDGLPVGAQLVAAPHREELLMNVAEQLENALALDLTRVADRWSATPTGAAR